MRNTALGNSTESITKTRLSNYILKILPPKNEKIQIKNSDIFHISAQNIDCGTRRGGSNEYPQSMSLSRNKKIIYTPVNPFYYIKVGFKAVKIR